MLEDSCFYSVYQL